MTELQIGDKAPSFLLEADGGGKIGLESYQGRPLIVYFYPKDDTPGCTQEACDFRDNFGDFKRRKVGIIGISKDDRKSHDKFKQKYKLPFPLASDTDGKVCQDYGVWLEKSMYGKKFMGIQRATFLIDKEGIIRKIWRDVKVTDHVAEVKATLEQL